MECDLTERIIRTFKYEKKINSGKGGCCVVGCYVALLLFLSWKYCKEIKLVQNVTHELVFIFIQYLYKNE